MYCNITKKSTLCIILFLSVSLFLFAQAEESLTLERETDDDGTINFLASNTGIIPIYVTVDFSTLTGLEPSVDLPLQIVLESGADQENILQLTPIPNQGYSIRYSYTWSNGDPLNTTPDPDYLYTFPFEHGTKQKLTQGYNGNFSHFGENQYALDFDLEMGTPIYAARDGLVVEVKEDSNRGGAAASYSTLGNYILVYHEDGTFGNYVHLRQWGAEVEVGDPVEVGQFIGYSGNTGRSTGPHLHFDVRIPLLDGSTTTIPIFFRGTDEEKIDPQPSTFYYSAHPGGPTFEATYGRDLTNADFADHSERIPQTDTISFREESIDEVTVVFLQNGYDETRSVDLQLRLTNMVASTELDKTFVVPPRSEVFVTILQLRPNATSGRYSYRYSHIGVD